MTTELIDIELDEISLVDKGDDPQAVVALFKREKTKTVDGKTLFASAFAHVSDPKKPSTWKFPLHDPQHVDAAVVALDSGAFDENRAMVKSRIRAAWREFHEDLPNVLKVTPLEAIRDALKGEGEARTFEEVLDEDEARRAVFESLDKLYEMYSALQRSIETIMTDDEITDKRSAVGESMDQFASAMRDALPNVEKLGDDDMTDEALQKQVEELQKKLDDEIAARKLAEDELAKLRSSEEEDEDDVTKGLSPEVRKRLEDQDAEIAELKKERETEFVRKHLSDTASAVSNVDSDEFRKVYLKLDADGRATLDKVLKGAQEAFSQIQSEVGKPGESDGGSAYERVMAEAEKLMTDRPSEFPTIEKARAHIWKTRRDLRKEYDEERRQTH